MGASCGSGSEAGSNRPAESRLDSWSAVASLLTSGLDAGSWHASLGLEAAFGSPPGLEVGSLAWAVSGARVGVSVVSGVPRMSGPGCRASGSSGTLAGTWTGPVPASEWPGPSPWVWGPSSIPFISETSELLAAILRWERAEGLCGDRREDGAVETTADPGKGGDRLGVRRKAVSTAAPRALLPSQGQPWAASVERKKSWGFLHPPAFGWDTSGEERSVQSLLGEPWED